jgi:hypothetical protein
VRRGLAALALAVLAACGTSSPSEVTVPLDREFTLRVGQTAVVDDTALRVSLAGVGDDSRCPTDVQCVWEGDAAVSVEIADTASPGRYELHTSGRFAREVEVGAYRVTLVRLDPAPRSSVAIPASEYRATLRVTR